MGNILQPAKQCVRCICGLCFSRIGPETANSANKNKQNVNQNGSVQKLFSSEQKHQKQQKDIELPLISGFIDSEDNEEKQIEHDIQDRDILSQKSLITPPNSEILMNNNQGDNSQDSDILYCKDLLVFPNHDIKKTITPSNSNPNLPNAAHRDNINNNYNNNNNDSLEYIFDQSQNQILQDNQSNQSNPLYSPSSQQIKRRVPSEEMFQQLGSHNIFQQDIINGVRKSQQMLNFQQTISINDLDCKLSLKKTESQNQSSVVLSDVESSVLNQSFSKQERVFKLGEAEKQWNQSMNIQNPNQHQQETDKITKKVQEKSIRESRQVTSQQAPTTIAFRQIGSIQELQSPNQSCSNSEVYSQRSSFRSDQQYQTLGKKGHQSLNKPIQYKKSGRVSFYSNNDKSEGRDSLYFECAEDVTPTPFEPQSNNANGSDCYDVATKKAQHFDFIQNPESYRKWILQTFKPNGVNIVIDFDLSQQLEFQKSHSIKELSEKLDLEKGLSSQEFYENLYINQEKFVKSKIRFDINLEQHRVCYILSQIIVPSDNWAELENLINSYNVQRLLMCFDNLYILTDPKQHLLMFANMNSGFLQNPIELMFLQHHELILVEDEIDELKEERFVSIDLSIYSSQFEKAIGLIKNHKALRAEISRIVSFTNVEEKKTKIEMLLEFNLKSLTTSKKDVTKMFEKNFKNFFEYFIKTFNSQKQN